MKRNIKFSVEAIRWFDRANGNTYHACRITRTRDGATLGCPLTYGYGDSYRQTALERMAGAKWLPVKYRNGDHMSYERGNNYPILWSVSDGLKRDAEALGSV